MGTYVRGFLTLRPRCCRVAQQQPKAALQPQPESCCRTNPVCLGEPPTGMCFCVRGLRLIAPICLLRCCAVQRDRAGDSRGRQSSLCSLPPAEQLSSLQLMMQHFPGSEARHYAQTAGRRLHRLPECPTCKTGRGTAVMGRISYRWPLFTKQKAEML